LRDFNLPKIVKPDQQIFLDLIRDLFPGIEVEQKQDAELYETIQKISIAKGL